MGCVGGIVGIEMQRYHLFGEITRVVEFLESTAPENRVQVSTACHDAVMRERMPACNTSNMTFRPPSTRTVASASSLEFEPRPEKHLSTSKGDIVEYDEVHGPTYLVSDIFGRSF